MKAVANGDIKAPGLSKAEADEYTSSNTGDMSFKKLPESTKAKKARKAALTKLAKGE
jgi:hypothetical protein